MPARPDEDPYAHEDFALDLEDELDDAPPPLDRPVRRALCRLLLALALLAAACALVPWIGPRSAAAAAAVCVAAGIVLLPLCVVLWFDFARAACAAPTSSRVVHRARLVLGIPQAVFGVLGLTYVLGVGGFLLYAAIVQPPVGRVFHAWATAIGAPCLVVAWHLLAGSFRRGRLVSEDDDPEP